MSRKGCGYDDCFSCPYADCINDELDSAEKNRRWWRESYYRHREERLAYMKEYRQRPEVKARHNELQRIRRKRKRELANG